MIDNKSMSIEEIRRDILSRFADGLLTPRQCNKELRRLRKREKWFDECGNRKK